MTTRTDSPPAGAGCATCGAALAADQRYCLNCGAAAPVAAASDIRKLLIGSAVGAAATVAPATAPAPAPTGGRLAVLPGREVSLGLAFTVFAFVLGLGAWAGATTTSGPGPAPIAIAAAPVAAPAPALAPDATTGTGTEIPPADDTAALDTADAPVTDVPVTDVPAETTDAATTDTATGDGTPAGGDTTPTTGGDDGAPDDGPTTPPLNHIWVVSLTGQGYDTLFDPQGQAPYLARDLTAKGTLLSRYFGVTTGGLANGVALVSGQGPNAATRTDCPAVADVAPGTVGKDDQAAGTGCLYSTDVFSIADLLTAQTRTWRAYAGALNAVGPCPRPVAGTPFTAPRVPFLAFHTIIDDAACADRVTGLARLASDLGSAKTTPQLSYVVPGPCEDGSTTPCAPGSAAGLPAADAFLRRTIPPILASPAYKDGGAIVILGDQAPQGGPDADRSTCCEKRPWQGKDLATSGGGRTGALVLSPLVKSGAVIDAGLDHYDLLKTLAAAFGVNPPGYAARSEVAGLPRETWARWKPKASAARR